MPAAAQLTWQQRRRPDTSSHRISSHTRLWERAATVPLRRAGPAITFLVVEPLEHVADERICLGLTVLPTPALHDPEASLAVPVRGAVQGEADGGQLPLSFPPLLLRSASGSVAARMNNEAPHTGMATIRGAQHFTANICIYAHLSHSQLQRRPALEDDDSTLLEAWPLRRRQRQPDRRRGALGRSCSNMHNRLRYLGI